MPVTYLHSGNSSPVKGVISSSSNDDNDTTACAIDTSCTVPTITNTPTNSSSNLQLSESLVSINDAVNIEEVQDLERLPSIVQDQMRLENKYRSDLLTIYDKTNGDNIIHIGEYHLTGMHFPIERSGTGTTTNKLRFYYCLEWHQEKLKCRKEGLRCPYNLFWYVPVTAFTTQSRVFLAYRPMLDANCNPTDWEFVYLMYTMCADPIHAAVVYNTKTGIVDFHTRDDGKFLFFAFTCKEIELIIYYVCYSQTLVAFVLLRY